MEGTLERKHKLQLGGKKVSERGPLSEHLNESPNAQNRSTHASPYLPSPGDVQRVDLTPRGPVQTQPVLLPGQEGHTQGEQDSRCESEGRWFDPRLLLSECPEVYPEQDALALT